ncbi:MAG: hypothetical protein M3Q24_00945 [bacterium]|nr:hypothetical protein [bacterium]
MKVAALFILLISLSACERLVEVEVPIAFYNLTEDPRQVIIDGVGVGPVLSKGGYALFEAIILVPRSDPNELSEADQRRVVGITTRNTRSGEVLPPERCPVGGRFIAEVVAANYRGIHRGITCEANY